MNSATSGRRLRSVQVMLAVLAVSLTFGLILSVIGGGAGPAPSQQTPSTEPGRSVAPGERMPGVPETPVDELETFDRPSEANADRQLDYQPSGTPSVEFPDGLGSLAAYAAQDLEWRSCDEGAAACVTVLAPLDWEDPEGPAVEIALRRYEGSDGSLGPLFVNPGGPGIGGQDFAGSLVGMGWDAYDIVGWDPRGTGRSTAVQCGTIDQTDAIFELDQSPDDDAEDQVLRDGHRDFAQQCRDASGPLLDHLSTIENARDLDLLRHLLGAPKLDYVGVSYGTFIGAVYAQLFPGSTGRLVLDSAVDITDSDDAPPQSMGFERALTEWASWCGDTDECFLDGSAEQIKGQISDWLKRLDAEPLAVGDRKLTQTYATDGILGYLYSTDEAYPYLSEDLQAAMVDSDGEALLGVSDAMNGRSPDKYETDAFAFPATLCADHYDEGADPVRERWRKSFELAPTVAPNSGIAYFCALWTADSAPTLRITAKGAQPILVVGTTGDSATPYEHAQTMAEQLESGRLLTLEGAGHGAIDTENRCLRKAIDDYLLEGVLPPEGTVCS